MYRYCLLAGGCATPNTAGVLQYARARTVTTEVALSEPVEDLLLMNALALAKRRAALRRRDEGAVMFIVAMTLAVLASVGVYALAAAATEVRTSGNERQNTQTHYLAEYGVLGAAREMAGSRALFTVKLMKSTTYRDTNCVSLQGVPTDAPPAALACVRLGAGARRELGRDQARSR